VTPASNPNDDTEPINCTEGSDYNIIFKLILFMFLFSLFSASRDIQRITEN
jgi:hypothetical protein